jgi:hypothetical protein
MGTTNNAAWRHHYNPQFYLKQFVDAAGEVLRTFLGPDGVLREKRFFPKATGYDEYLDSLRQPIAYQAAPRSDAIETDILRPLDGHAANAMKKMIVGGPSSLGDAERAHWALFMNSLLERHPTKLGERDNAARNLAEDHRKRFLANRSVTPAAHERWTRVLLEFSCEAAATNAVRALMVREILEPTVIDYFKGMTWIKAHVETNTEMEFVTGDVPIVLNGGASGPIEAMSIALSPQDSCSFAGATRFRKRHWRKWC